MTAERAWRRLPAHETVDEALDYCEAHGWPTPRLHRLACGLVVGDVETTPRAVHEIVREWDEAGR